MRKKFLSVALAGLMLGATSAQAVHINPDGVGEVLLYPFYSVEQGNDTYISVVNTTGQYKAVRVRFREAMEGTEVLGFNLYLSPNDHWSAVVTSSNGGAALRTADTSCTVPMGLASTSPGAPGNLTPFRDTGYGNANGGMARTREGYVEIVEMGEVTDPALQAAIQHVDGVPGSCATLHSAWQSGGLWANDPNTGMAVVNGGLYGYGVLINVGEGTNGSYEAVALRNFSNLILHSPPVGQLPDLSASNSIASFMTEGGVVQIAFPSGQEAVGAVLMRDTIMNDYVLEPSIQAGTDWVFTFPTRRYHSEDSTLFTTAFEYPAGGCEPIDIAYWDREGAEPSASSGGSDGIDFSPRPPVVDLGPTEASLCFASNVLTFGDSDVLGASERIRSNLNPSFSNGWMRVGLDTETVGERTLVGRNLADDAEVYLYGLPVIGFAMQKYVNGNVGGVMSNYAGLIPHRSSRKFVEIPG